DVDVVRDALSVELIGGDGSVGAGDMEQLAAAVRRDERVAECPEGHSQRTGTGRERELTDLTGRRDPGELVRARLAHPHRAVGTLGEVEGARAGGQRVDVDLRRGGPGAQSQ